MQLRIGCLLRHLISHNETWLDGLFCCSRSSDTTCLDELWWSGHVSLTKLCVSEGSSGCNQRFVLSISNAMGQNTRKSPSARFCQWYLPADSRSRRILCSFAWFLQSEAYKASTIGCYVRFLRLRFGFEHVCKQIVVAGFIRDELCEIDLLCMRSLSLFLLNKPQKLFVCQKTRLGRAFVDNGIDSTLVRLLICISSIFFFDQIFFFLYFWILGFLVGEVEMAL